MVHVLYPILQAVSCMHHGGHGIVRMCSEYIVDVVAFTHFTALIITPSMNLVLTLHRQPTSTPGHVMLTLH